MSPVRVFTQVKRVIGKLHLAILTPPSLNVLVMARTWSHRRTHNHLQLSTTSQEYHPFSHLAYTRRHVVNSIRAALISGDILLMRPDKSVCLIVLGIGGTTSIASFAQRVSQSLAEYDYKAILIDANYHDAGHERVEHLSGPYQSRFILHHGNGSPASIVSRILLEETAGKIILMDADQQASDEILPAMVRCLESNDLVVASSASADYSNRSRRPEKRLTVRIGNWLALPLAPNIKDRMSGFLGFRRALVEPTSLSTCAANIGLEIIAQGHFRSAAHIHYTPIANTNALSSVPSPGAWPYFTQIVRLYLSKFHSLISWWWVELVMPLTC